jgi:hypothetical protein
MTADGVCRATPDTRQVEEALRHGAASGDERSRPSVAEKIASRFRLDGDELPIMRWLKVCTQLFIIETLSTLDESVVALKCLSMFIHLCALRKS